MPKNQKRAEQLPVLHPDAAGVDIGASEIFIAVSPDRDPKPVRSFATFTRDLNALADWLQRCGIRTVAMESTSVDWIPLYQVLEERGLDVCLVNAQYLRNVPGRKTDVSDCQWIQYLHSVGLLRPSFRPPAEICALRSLWRHRASLIQMAAEHVLHIQKRSAKPTISFASLPFYRTPGHPAQRLLRFLASRLATGILCRAVGLKSQNAPEAWGVLIVLHHSPPAPTSCFASSPASFLCNGR
jgi:transposase